MIIAEPVAVVAVVVVLLLLLVHLCKLTMRLQAVKLSVSSVVVIGASW